jgi:hypothetical protein
MHVHGQHTEDGHVSFETVAFLINLVVKSSMVSDGFIALFYGNINATGVEQYNARRVNQFSTVFDT